MTRRQRGFIDGWKPPGHAAVPQHRVPYFRGVSPPASLNPEANLLHPGGTTRSREDRSGLRQQGCT
jgi:hypothetical protein